MNRYLTLLAVSAALLDASGYSAEPTGGLSKKQATEVYRLIATTTMPERVVGIADTM